MRTAGALFLGLTIATAPALTWAQHSSGGGGGGGHASGGAHFGGGGGGHFSGGAHFGGGFGGHYAGAHAFAAPHYGVSGHYYGGRYFAPTGHGVTYAGAHYVAHSGYVGRPAAVAPHPPGAPGAPGYWHGGHPWVGGYWHGAYWPHAWYYPGWAWYLPILPVGYATFWWGGVPYYYWNSLYYTWSPADNGYVVTDPPPAAGTEGSADAGGGYEQAPEANYGGNSSADVYVYPRNGQTEAQTQNDRYECHSWAVSQSGFDPTRQDTPGNPGDYKRAMVACLDARGYTAR
jgi:hypothetical protein